MRNLKKLMALVVTVAMLATFFAVPALAQDMDDPEILESTGMLKGTGSGVTPEYLESKPMRYQTAILFLRLQGLEEDAKAFPGTVNFTDAATAVNAGGMNLSAENQAVLAYLYANPELGYAGYPDGTFKPFKESTVKEYYKVLLVALGYKQDVDYTWDEVIEFADGKGLSSVAGVEDFTIDHLATATVEALKAEVKAGGTLTAKLVEEGAIDAEKAYLAGLYDAPVIDLAVTDVSASNLKEIVVAFNDKLDKDTVEKDNFKLNGSALSSSDSISLNDDGMSVTISLGYTFDPDMIDHDDGPVTVDNTLSNQAEIKIEVNGVKSVGGAEIAAGTEAVGTAYDATLPVVKSVELIGPSKFKVIFSEPIAYADGAGEVEFDNGIIGIIESYATGSREVTIELGVDSLAEGDYPVKISGYKDMAGHVALSKTLTLAYVKDETVPVATIKEATQTYVKVEFNKPVTTDDSDKEINVNHFYHTFTSWNPVEVVANAAKTEFTVYFVKTQAMIDADNDRTDYPIAEGTFRFVVNYDADGVIQDEWGNKLSSNIVLSGSVTADSIAPVITEVVAGDTQKEVNIFVSENVDVSDATITVKDSDGEEVDVDVGTPTQDSDENYYIPLTFDEDLEGDYTIEVKDVVDMALEPNTMATVTVTVSVSDLNAIDTDEVLAAGVDGTSVDYIYVTYPENMKTSGENSVLNKANYLIDYGSGAESLASADKVELFGSGSKKVRIVLADQDEVNFKTGGSLDLTIGRVADTAGNTFNAFSFTKNVVQETAPKIEEIKVIADNKLKITIDKTLTSVTSKGIKTMTEGVGDGAYHLVGSTSVAYDGAKTILTVIVNAKSKLLSTQTDDTAISVEIVADKLKADYGMYVPEGVVIQGGGNVTEKFTKILDGRAPVYNTIGVASTVSGAVYNNTVTITFKEDLIGTHAAAYGHDLIVKDSDGDTLTAVVDYETQVVDGDLVIIINGTKENLQTMTDDHYTVKTKDSITYIKDLNGNKAATFGTKKIENPS